MLRHTHPALFAFALTLSMSGAPRVHALTADMGSSGSYGAINITSNTVIALPPDGVLHATTVTVAASATLSFSYTGLAHPGVVILATGDVTINGTIDVSGQDSTANTAGRAGPGGSSGGSPSTYRINYPAFSPSYFMPSAGHNVGLRPRGGLGGPSAYRQVPCTTVGAGGGGGGGSLVILSNTRISGTGTIDAGGGAANATVPTGCGLSGYAAQVGEDGHVRLGAPTVSLNTASVVAQGLRIDAVIHSGAPTLTRGSVAGSGTYQTGTALTRFPTLPVATIIAINGVTVAPSTAVQIPAATTNPWNVTVNVSGCTAPSVTAVVHSRLPNGTFVAGETVVASPTGDDDIVVSINTTGSASNPDANSALLFPAVWCGTSTTP